MSKALAFTIGALLTALLAVPLLTGGDNGVDTGCAGVSDVERILATIRDIESADRYDLTPNAGGASGAYQYIDTTWRAWADRAGIDTASLPHAYLAPPSVQDAVAALNVRAILQDHPDITAVPVAWYWPRALDHPEDLDIIPAPSAGNRLTVRQYQEQWLASYQRQPGSGLGGATATSTSGPAPACAIIPTVTGDVGTVIAFALAQLGKPYVFDTDGPDTYDCSGLTRAAYRQIGIDLPHYTGSQVQMGTAIDWHKEPVQAGDLVFIPGGSPPEDFGHVGIVVDTQRWINAPRTGDVVKIAPMPAVDRIQAVRRLVAAAQATSTPSRPIEAHA